MSFDSFPPTPGAATIDIDITSTICTKWSEQKQQQRETESERAEVRLSWRETAVCTSIIPLAHTRESSITELENKVQIKWIQIQMPSCGHARVGQGEGDGEYTQMSLKATFLLTHSTHTCRQAVTILVLVLVLVLALVLFCPGARSRSRPGAFTFYFRIIWKIRKCAARSQMTKRDMQTTKDQQQQRPLHVCVCVCVYLCVSVRAPPDCRKVKSAKRKSTRRRASPLSRSPSPRNPSPCLLTSPPLPIGFALYLSGVCPVRLLCVFPALLPGCLAQFFNSIFCISHACTGHGTRDTGHTGMGEQQGGVGIIIWIIRHLRPAWTRPASLPPPLSPSPFRLPVCLSAGCCAGLARASSTFHLSTSQLAAFHAPAAHRMTKIS